MDYCICCGAYVPEGMQVCFLCQDKYIKGVWGFGLDEEAKKDEAGKAVSQSSS